jgi:hypothetical protein
VKGYVACYKGKRRGIGMTEEEDEELLLTHTHIHTHPPLLFLPKKQ